MSGAQAQNLDYNAVGNMVYNSGYGGAYTYGPTVSGCSAGTQPVKPHAVLTANGSTYTYDCNGNLTSGGGRTITWNYDNLPSSVTQGGATTTFAYNANGGRIQKTQGANTTLYFGLTEQVNGSWVQYYYAGPILVAKKQGATKTWYHSDRLGSIRLMTDASGVEVKDYDYQAFGATQSQSGTMINERGFTGHITDAETGLIYMVARYFDASLARFVSADTVVPDPANPQALNRYSYVLNNPINNTDPTGHSCPEGYCLPKSTPPNPTTPTAPGDPSENPTTGQNVSNGTRQADNRPSGYQRLADQLSGDNWWCHSSAEASSTTCRQKTSREDAPSDPPPPGLDPLYAARKLLKSLGTDAVGWRLNGNVGYYVGISGSIDAIYNLNTDELTLYVAGGGQGYTMGGSVSTGLLLVGNLPDNGGYTGWSGGLDVTVAEDLKGVEVSFVTSKDSYKGAHPTTFYVGWSPGMEVTGPLAASHTWTMEQALKFFGLSP